MSDPRFTGDFFGITSANSTLCPAQILFSGSVGVGNTATINVTVGSTGHTFTQTGIAGDTLFTLIGRLITDINAALSPSIVATVANPLVPMIALSPHRDGNPLPSVTFSVTGAIGATLVSQALDILDAYPQIYGAHVTGFPPKTGDSVMLYQHLGPTATDYTNPTGIYFWIMTHIGDPNLATLSGYTDFGGASNVASNGYVSPWFRASRGLAFFDASGNLVPGGDKGFGTINLPAAGGLYVDGVRVDQKAAFRASMSGNQSGIASGTPTRLNYQAAAWNVGVVYDTTNSRWTPPKGPVRLKASAMWNDAQDAYFYLYIAKNGISFAGNILVGNASGKLPTNSVDTLDYANGTDYYEVQALFLNASGTHTISGQPTYSWFEGHQT